MTVSSSIQYACVSSPTISLRFTSSRMIGIGSSFVRGCYARPQRSANGKNGAPVEVRMGGRTLPLASCRLLLASFCAAAEPSEPYAEALEGFNARLEFVPVKGGVNRMKPVGNRPAAEENVGDLFVGKTEVPWEVFDVFATSMDRTDAQRREDDAKPRPLRLRPSQVHHDRDHGFGHAGHPAISMTSASAERFCQWLSTRTGKKYRLPTEAEFEYFARAGRADEAFTDDAVAAEAWGKENAEHATHPVAQLKANPFGLHDVLGNVAEWVI